MRLNIFKAKSDQKLTDSISSSLLYEKLEPEKPTELVHQKKLGEMIPIEFDEVAPKFLTISKLDFSGTEIHCGIIKDPTSIGGLRYVVIQPRLSIQDKKNFDIIKKLL
ncbi:MAG: type IV secretory pathway protein, partial [Thaumarchaeota archaeon]|nr:type IV secretory pathway protein [Nitrososphaerota archaeon]